MITGPTGIIGTALIQHLINQKVHVYAVVRPNSKRLNLIPNNSLVHVIECDLSKLHSIDIQKIGIVDVFYHFGWEGTSKEERNDVDLQAGNIEYTLEAVRLSAKLHCQSFVGAGSQAEYGRVEGTIAPTTPCFPEIAYGVAKLCACDLSRLECNNLGLRHCWGRIISAYGPNDSENTMIRATIRNLLMGKDCPFTPCEQQWDYIYSKDVAKAFYLIGEKGKNNSIYCLGSGTTYPLRHYVEIMKSFINSPSRLLFGAIPYSPKQVMHLVTDIHNLKEDTGFTTDYPFERGIAESIDYEKSIMKL